MPRLFRRETFIALRARRQAHEIARDILNPHIDAKGRKDSGFDVPLAHFQGPRQNSGSEPPLWTPLLWVVAALVTTLLLGSLLVLIGAIAVQ